MSSPPHMKKIRRQRPIKQGSSRNSPSSPPPMKRIRVVKNGSPVHSGTRHPIEKEKEKLPDLKRFYRYWEYPDPPPPVRRITPTRIRKQVRFKEERADDLVVGSKFLPFELADTFTQKLNCIGKVAKKNLEDMDVVQRLMANFIVVKIATGGEDDDLEEAAQVGMACERIAKECQAIVDLVRSTMEMGSSATAPKIPKRNHKVKIEDVDANDDFHGVRSALAKMSERCASADEAAVGAEEILEGVSADKDRVMVVTWRLRAVRERLEGVRRCMEALGH